MKKSYSLKSGLSLAAKAHFVFAGLLAGQVIIYDAAKLITPEAVLKRWQAIAALLVITTIVWYLAKNKLAHKTGYVFLTLLLAAADVALASQYVYTQRGMASKAVFLYVIGLVTIAVLRSKAALYAGAAIATAAYTTTTITYFVVNFNEGYKVELYGEVVFYSAMFFIVSALTWNAIRPPSAG